MCGAGAAQVWSRSACNGGHMVLVDVLMSECFGGMQSQSAKCLITVALRWRKVFRNSDF